MARETMNEGGQFTTTCKDCGAKKVMWWHRLTPGLVNALWKFAHGVGKKGANDVHIVHDLTGNLSLNHSEQANFQKLRFHALIAKVRDDDGKHIRGRWLLTKRGGDFLRGTIRVPSKVLTYRNVVQESEHDEDERMVHISDFYRKYPYFEERFDWEIADGRVVKIRDEEGVKRNFKVTQTPMMAAPISACCHSEIVNEMCTKCSRPAFKITV